MKFNFTFPLTISIVLFFCLTSCDSGYADNNALSYEEAKLTIEQEENMYPTRFLSVDGTYRKNLIGEWVLEGKVISTATVAKYKDVVLNVSYYSKTETLLGTEKQVVYDYFTPGAKGKFKIKSFGYNNAKSVGIEVAEATATN